MHLEFTYYFLNSLLSKAAYFHFVQFRGSCSHFSRNDLLVKLIYIIYPLHSSFLAI